MILTTYIYLKQSHRNTFQGNCMAHRLVDLWIISSDAQGSIPMRRHVSYWTYNNSLIAGPDYIRFFPIYISKLKTSFLSTRKIKRDINQKNVKIDIWISQRIRRNDVCNDVCITPYNAELFLFKPWRLKCVQFEIIRFVLVSSFRIIWIPMLWVYNHYTYFNSFGAGTVFIRQNLTSTNVRFWRIKTVPALKGFI